MKISPRFLRSTATSLLTSALDFMVLIGAVELFHVNYVLATWFGTVVGALSNFTINKHWAFKGSSIALPSQFARFVFVQAGASGLQTLGVWLLTRFVNTPYQASKLIVAVLVSVGWNYPMNKAVVFFRAHAPKQTATPPCPSPEP
jgi:putative flippase GtrA